MHKCPHSDCPAIFGERAEMALHFLDHHSPGAEADKKKHEQRIRSALDNHGINYIHQFKVQNRNDAGGVADKHYAGDLFVDFLISTEGGDVVVLEVDQMQHKSYGVKNECQRMQTVTTLLRQNKVCKPDCAIIWLRYNPDSYKEGCNRYVAVDAVHEAEPCLVRYISSLQGGVIDADGGVAERKNDTEIIYLRYDKEHATSIVPQVASDIDFFPGLIPLVRTFDLSECAVLVQADIVIKQEVDVHTEDIAIEMFHSYGKPTEDENQNCSRCTSLKTAHVGRGRPRHCQFCLRQNARCRQVRCRQKNRCQTSPYSKSNQVRPQPRKQHFHKGVVRQHPRKKKLFAGFI